MHAASPASTDGWRRLESRRLRLGYKSPEDGDREEPHRCHAHEACRVAEPLDDEPRNRRAERGPDPGKGSNETLCQVEPAASLREVGDDDGRQHAERGAAQPVKRLNGDEQRRVGSRPERCSADRHDAKPNQEERSPAPAVRGPPHPWREEGNDELRNDDQC